MLTVLQLTWRMEIGTSTITVLVGHLTKLHDDDMIRFADAVKLTLELLDPLSGIDVCVRICVRIGIGGWRATYGFWSL